MRHDLLYLSHQSLITDEAALLIPMSSVVRTIAHQFSGIFGISQLIIDNAQIDLRVIHRYRLK